MKFLQEIYSLLSKCSVNVSRFSARFFFLFHGNSLLSRHLRRYQWISGIITFCKKSTTRHSWKLTLENDPHEKPLNFTLNVCNFDCNIIYKMFVQVWINFSKFSSSTKLFANAFSAENRLFFFSNLTLAMKLFQYIF